MLIIEDMIEIEAPIEIVFDAERDISLHVATQRHHGERAVDGVTGGLINLGEEVEWEARHFSVRQRLRVKIVEMERPKYFRDEMIRGAFESFSHEHYVREISPGRTEKRDVMKFEAPLGILGAMAEALFLRAYMTSLLRTKNRTMKRLIENGDESRLA
jgi:ligand-binding SRPBCC domain-containing protein